ncbi:MAG: hypothetical protein E3J69_00030 [Anaerolineales bacterium]|jgi:hypothetical protein|nr:MAG: hypothetical protein E3J69_00030 [Anaerolineales bacterium]
MESIDYNLDLFEAMLDEIEDFLLSVDIFWPLAKRAKPDSPPYPRLSTGGLLMTQDESLAQETEMNSDQKARYANLQSQWKRILNKWRSALGRKSEQEMGMRLNLWRAYLSDLEEGNASHFDYHRETRNRVQFTRLRTLTASNSKTLKLEKTMRSLDARLLNLTIASKFIWDDRLRETYPEREFGFLYRQPREISK